jgi:hypothetical protein
MGGHRNMTDKDRYEERDEKMKIVEMNGNSDDFYNELKKHVEDENGGRYWMVLLHSPTSTTSLATTVYEFSGTVQEETKDGVVIDTVESLDEHELIKCYHESALELIEEKKLDAIPMLIDFEKEMAYCTTPPSVEMREGVDFGCIVMPAQMFLSMIFMYYEAFAEQVLDDKGLI